MAKKAGKPTSSSGTKAQAKGKARRKGKTTVPDRVIDAALALAAGRGWRRLSLGDIANEAGLTLAGLRAVFPSKAAILGGFLRRTDERVLAGGGTAGLAEGSSARDRLFDVLMRRFDVMRPHRDAITAIARDSLFDPLAALCLGPSLMCSMAWMLEAAGLNSAGLKGGLSSKGLALVYLGALRAWLKDDSADLAKTMAALDRGLRRAETVAALFCPGQDETSAANRKAA